jgi:nucleoside-diphosphate-sugar epimerase
MDDATATRVTDLYEHLAATDSLPIDPRANQWLGEAEAVAADLHHNDATPEVVRERAGHVVHLLENASETGSDEADEHVAAALELARELVDGGDSK